jgi:hypothetical protein
VSIYAMEGRIDLVAWGETTPVYGAGIVEVGSNWSSPVGSGKQCLPNHAGEITGGVLGG